MCCALREFKPKKNTIQKTMSLKSFLVNSKAKKDLGSFSISSYLHYYSLPL